MFFFSPVTNEIIDYPGSGADASLCVKPPLSLSVNILPTTLSDWLRNMLITLSSIYSTPLCTLLFLFPYLYLFCSVIRLFVSVVGCYVLDVDTNVNEDTSQMFLR